jgi:hypothetical protein
MTQVYTCYRNTVFILTLLTPSLHKMFRPPGPSSGESQTLSFFIFQEDFSLNESVVLSFYNELLPFVLASYILK